MVKNTKGGSSHKSQARKFATSSKPSNNSKTRFSEDEYEYYAQVIATLGNGMCHVMCKDGKKRLCFIRGKFRGRGKRDNIICNGKWVLVGGRDFESEKSGTGKDLEKCDLLEVYSDLDKERLKSIGDFGEFIKRDHLYCNQDNPTTDFIDFADNEKEEEYRAMMNDSMNNLQKKQITLHIEEENDNEEIDVDDI
jgi:translation initiation factor 1A